MTKRKNKNDLLPAGRPTKYNDEMCDNVIAYLERCKKEKDIPVMAELANELHISKSTMYEWVKIHPLFSNSLRQVAQYQEANLIKMGLKKEYDSSLTKFILASNHGYYDRVKNENIHTVTADESIDAKSKIEEMLNYETNKETDTNSIK